MSRSKYETEHFNLSEFSSPGVNGPRVQVPEMYLPNVLKLMQQLEIVRLHIGGSPMNIISGYRTLEYNKLNKGRASKSKHMTAEAADIKVTGHKPAYVYWAIKDLMDAGDILTGGLACYPTFVHYDIRGYPARWRMNPKRP